MNLKSGIESIVYYLTIAFAVVVFLLALDLDLKNINIGNDIAVFCRAGVVLAEGKNPYLVSDLGGDLSWNYPAIMAAGFRFACPLLRLELTYIPVYAFFFFASLLPWVREKDFFYGFILCTTGLFNLGWVAITGNISTVEFLLFSLATWFFINKKNLKWAMSIFGVMAGMKLVPLLYVPAYIFPRGESKWNFLSLAWLAAGFILLPLLSFIITPDLFPWYIRQTLGLIPDQHAPFGETMVSVLNPSFALMLLSFLGTTTLTPPLFHHAYSLLIYFMGLILFFILARRVSALKPFDTTEVVFFLGIIVLSIALPRAKPYNFLPFLFCFYMISRHQSRFLRAVYLVLLSIAPTFLHLVFFYTEDSSALLEARFPSILVLPLQTVLIHHQMFFLCIAAVVCISTTIDLKQLLHVSAVPDDQ